MNLKTAVDTKNAEENRRNFLCVLCALSASALKAFPAAVGGMNPSRRRWRHLSCAFLLAASLPAPATAQELGRLFFTPELRGALDRRRELKLSEQQEIEEDPGLTIDGVVTRSDGQRTIWINGIARDGDSAVPVTPLGAHPGRIVVRTEDGSAAPAGVGDTVNRSTGETIDLLGGGRVRIGSAPRR
ncbi:MAG: hypothetical protein LBE85_02995 [Candidatus Accumulibacter sp.]|jgi:ferric-dicitrate binding protein FerR (iron transport regulator)|nr:hypothetical protein [Accumulibacter sp.]